MAILKDFYDEKTFFLSLKNLSFGWKTAAFGRKYCATGPKYKEKKNKKYIYFFIVLKTIVLSILCNKILKIDPILTNYKYIWKCVSNLQVGTNNP